jgi:hypothetical protein
MDFWQVAGLGVCLGYIAAILRNIHTELQRLNAYHRAAAVALEAESSEPSRSRAA